MDRWTSSNCDLRPYSLALSGKASSHALQWPRASFNSRIARATRAFGAWFKKFARLGKARERLKSKRWRATEPLLPPRLIEISQIGWRLVLLGWHQHTVS